MQKTEYNINGGGYYDKADRNADASSPFGIRRKHAASGKPAGGEQQYQSETVIKKDANEFAVYQYDASEEGNGTYSNPRKRGKKKKPSDEEEKKKEVAPEEEANKQTRINIQI